MATLRDENNLQGQNQEGGEQSPPQQTETPPANEGEETESKTFTEEEFNKALQAESDRRVTEALKKAQGKWEADYKQKLETEKDEAARLAKMSAEERAKEEFKKEQEKFNTERAEFNKKALRMEVVEQLSQEGLDTSFATFLVGENAETSKENITAFKEAFNSAVEKAVKERLPGTPPPAGGSKENLDPFLKGMNEI